ncbi:MAG: hypothetical protein DCF15_01090 [Phormidesmis priestleyi]|uniref:Uncharacterized protein n=1 Tax=Phormidesmis priestleyi TaxID=268141 RepID=A0A2W4XTZ3_9CYAN|nr:MAG: hypothetical protein DCF15_01090 [Phormidesmis priestleyi]
MTNQPNQHYERALLLAENHRYPLAKQEALMALAEDPQSDRTYNLLSYCYANQQRYREAIQAAQQAIEIAPEHAFHYYRLGQCV